MQTNRISIRTTAALAVALAAAGAMAWPVAAQVHNNSWRTLVEPESGAELGAYSGRSIVLRDDGQLARVVSNIETLNEMAGFIEDAGLSIVLELPEPAAAQDPVPAPQPAADAAPAGAGGDAADAGAADDAQSQAAAGQGKTGSAQQDQAADAGQDAGADKAADQPAARARRGSK